MSLQGPVNCAATIVREEGLRGLWSGASPTVLRNGTNQMCLFWAKNHMDSVLWSERPRFPVSLLIGLCWTVVQRAAAAALSIHIEPCGAYNMSPQCAAKCHDQQGCWCNMVYGNECRLLLACRQA